MSKQTEKLKKQLIEISEVVNLFKSEAVQVKIVDKLLDAIIESERTDADTDAQGKKQQRFKPEGLQIEHHAGRKKPGATKVLNQLLNTTDFFNTTRSISAIADHCKTEFDSDFKTSELSGILLKLANEHKLKRERSHANNRYEYVKA